MIDEHKNSACRIFFCYRESGAETAKILKQWMKDNSEWQFGRVWYSDDENIGNFTKDIEPKLRTAEYVVIFLTPDFTQGFLKPDGGTNLEGYTDGAGKYHGGCVTVQEIIELERQRQLRDNLTVICVNINGYNIDDDELIVLERVFKNEGILKEDSIKYYKNLNHNDYYRRGSDFNAFASRITKGLEESRIESISTTRKGKKEKRGLFGLFKKDTGVVEGDLSIISGDRYSELFQIYLKGGKYPVVKIFGYTGEVVTNDLITYLDRYQQNTELRMLHRNPLLERRDESSYNEKIVDKSLRPWNKAAAIERMCLEDWNFALKREIRYYYHQPIIKGTVFCTADGVPMAIFFNFQKWEELPMSGGSQFKSVPSDMIFINEKCSDKSRIIMERLNSQFDYEWQFGLTQKQMAEQIKGVKKDED